MSLSNRTESGLPDNQASETEAAVKLAAVQASRWCQDPEFSADIKNPI